MEMEQLQQQMTDKFREMKLRSDKYKTQLASMFEDIESCLVDDYGIIEDETFLPPLVTCDGGLNILVLKKNSQIQNIHKNVMRMKVLLKTINSAILEVQKTSFCVLVYKKRKREYDSDFKTKKLNLKRAKTVARQDNISLNTVTDPSICEIFDLNEDDFQFDSDLS